MLYCVTVFCSFTGTPASHIHMLEAFLDGKLPLAVNGGYDFVDVRDAARVIVPCTEYNKTIIIRCI